MCIRDRGNDPAWLKPHMERTRNMFERNKNHASVTFWSLGNEAGNGYNFYQTYLWTKAADSAWMNRPVNYERAQWEWNTDMYVPQYPGAGWLEEIGRKGSDRPVMPSEYAHAMGKMCIRDRTYTPDLAPARCRKTLRPFHSSGISNSRRYIPAGFTSGSRGGWGR